MKSLLRALTRRRADPETPVEMLDAEMLRGRVGEPLPPKSEAPEPAGYRRADGRSQEPERSWRKKAGLKR